MLNFLIKVFTAVSIYELLFIFFARIVEVTLSTLRRILLSKGYTKISALLAFVGVFIWVVVASKVLVDIINNPMKVVVYSLGFALGVYLGSIIEGKVGLGNVLIQVILPYEEGVSVTSILREDGFAITNINGVGLENEKLILMIYVKRRIKDQVIKKITLLTNNALVVSNELTNLAGGYTFNNKDITSRD